MSSIRRPVRVVRGNLAHYVHPDRTVYYRRIEKDADGTPKEVGGLRKLRDQMLANRLYAEVVREHRRKVAREEAPDPEEVGILR